MSNKAKNRLQMWKLHYNTMYMYCMRSALHEISVLTVHIVIVRQWKINVNNKEGVVLLGRAHSIEQIQFIYCMSQSEVLHQCFYFVLPDQCFTTAGTLCSKWDWGSIRPTSTLGTLPVRPRTLWVEQHSTVYWLPCLCDLCRSCDIQKVSFGFKMTY